jgi:secretin/TonB-like protein
MRLAVLGCWLVWLFTIAAGFAIVAASAQSSVRESQIGFDIPAQPLGAALEVFSAVSQLQVLYVTALASGRNSSAVNGVYSRQAALQELLKGTGLEFKYTEDHAFTLVQSSRGTRGPAIREFHHFLGGVQSGIMAALCRRPETRPGDFKVALEFSIGSSGQLEHPSLLNSTGDERRDAAISEALTSLVLAEAPPQGMPQPVTMVLRDGPPRGMDECGRVR